MTGFSCVPIKLYWQKQAWGHLWPTGQEFADLWTRDSPEIFKSTKCHTISCWGIHLQMAQGCLLIVSVVILMSIVISYGSSKCAHACQQSPVFSSENAFVIPSISDVLQRKVLLRHAIHPKTKKQAPATCKVIKDLTWLLHSKPSALPRGYKHIWLI